jgi:imidazolonepropionase-like amidohydrolase
MNILFTNVFIFDGTGSAEFAGEVLVRGNRIAEVVRAAAPPLSRDDARVVDGHGALLMPGLVEPHAHLTWPTSVERFVPGMSLPPEDLTLNTARNARVLLDHGYTSAYSAGALSKSLEIFLKTHIDSGSLPGPRLIPSSVEREPPNDSAFLDAGKAADHERGPGAVRAFVRECGELGAKSVKFLLSGESALKPGASHELLYTEAEVRAAGEQSLESDVWLTGHAHAAEAVKMGLRNHFRVLYHCTYADSEAIEMLAARKDQVFVAPTIGIAQAALDAKPSPHVDMSQMKADAETVLQRQKTLVPQLKKLGVRLLPGGDYGFPFNPTGRNARDLELFVHHFDYTPGEVLMAATKLGGEIMGMGHELGQVRPGFLADLLLVTGDPLKHIGVLQDIANLAAIMKDGKFHKAPL